MTAVKRKKAATARRLGDWKKEEAAALRMLRGDGRHFVKVRDTDSSVTDLVPVPLPGAHDRLERALVAMLGGSGELSADTGRCVITERPPEHISLSARLSVDGTISPCACSGCEAARKCNCPACRAARRFARSVEADRDEHASTVAEIAADEIYEAAKPYLKKKPLRNRAGFTTEPAPRTAWTALAQYLSRLRRDPTITTGRLRKIVSRRHEK